MSSLTTAPASVQGWFAARTEEDPRQRLHAVLTPDAVLDFAGRKISGADAVVEHVLAMPSGPPSSVEWTVLPGGDDRAVTVRGTGPDGAPLASPGGPMTAIDFAFTLGEKGLIAGIAPHPHHSEPADLSAPLTTGQTAPDFVLPDVDGIEVPLHTDGTAATVVVFTCNACPWALGWHDRLQHVARDYESRRVRVLHINANDPAVSPKDTIENSRLRVLEGQFAGPYLVDEGQRVARRWGARHTPEVFVLNAGGVVAYHGAPDAAIDDESLNAIWLRDALDQVLAGTARALASTEPVGCTIKWTMQ
jgi:peroxiredoxin